MRCWLGSSPAAQAVIALVAAGAAASAIAQASQLGAAQDPVETPEVFLARLAATVSVVSKTVDQNGRVVDCVDVGRQPAHGNPLLKGHEVQRNPSPQLLALLPHPVRRDTTVTGCPAGTVEMVLPSRHDIARAGSVRSFHAKYPAELAGTTRRLAPPAVVGHEYAVSFEYLDAIAAQSTFNIWASAVQGADFSLTQLWMVGGSGAAGNPLQTLEIGSQVYPQKYGSGTPRLFIYWTADGYANTGCYNLDCAAFVQTSNVLSFGGALPASAPGGTQHEGAVAFYRDPATANWILFFFDGTSYIQSGYYPAALFQAGMLAQKAWRIDFGGEVYNPTSRVNTHTTTDMGSGAFPSAGYGQAMYQRGLKYMTLAGTILDFPASTSTRLITNPGCYDISAGNDAAWGGFIYFGGPGYNSQCLIRPE